jgi:predicted deacylase
MAAAFDARFRAWIVPDCPGVLSREAHRAGKNVAGVEWGGGGALDPAGVTALLDALNRCLNVLGLRADQAASAAADAQPPVAGDYATAPAAGIFSAHVALGDQVAAGDLICVLMNPLTGTTTSVIAPNTGQVGGLAHRAWLEAGDRVFYLG